MGYHYVENKSSGIAQSVKRLAMRCKTGVRYLTMVGDFLLPPRSDRFWGPPSLLFKCILG